ncbi:XRE family transcriptional regulator [Amycolatopsis mediterranei S699]|uniref:XRE family transcriptional regulator n=2 Tax=Amycolatopsis mediterranei TaxID=33910 RepID=A0A0H3DFY6_AMYMU|nr:ImmA/IrrE family metallo-endopeptidase [Amycolatopsis mediterranei]ADJ49038.1 XRE family transcriptional regulator [Amycolatopsis mediterranei U32]AEK45994.1 XRE family transcriptional regulator [Amycolatopsis mediterranei S699]AFO80745.1 XRE family transcriptional regulator [Amycolatopsis mediterranei S699]AGT87873.1 XRE family transcriptional regulator [Amycolatopsis mediterranei RB]KDU93840.1 XRE family transcriptional regulator [Amycolatopsis mediterranei]
MAETSANPVMLTLARDSRELTQSDVAREMSERRGDGPKITQGYVSKAEAGATSVSGERLELFAAVLGYPTELLTLSGNVFGLGTTCVHHRKRQSLSAAAGRRVHAYLNLARIQTRHLLHGTDVQPANAFFRFPVSVIDTARDAAAEVRKRWRIPPGPVESMVDLLEQAGGIVVQRRTPSAAWDAVSQWPDDEAPVFLLNAATPPDRQRFTLAHELGHIVCHPVVGPNQEKEADEFAAEFLMPAAQIVADLKSDLDIAMLGALKQRWKVSMAALVRRAHDLGVITDWRYRTLNVELSSLGYRTDEPGVLPAEHPRLPLKAAREWITRQQDGLDDLAARTLLTTAEFTEVFGLAGQSDPELASTLEGGTCG